ncbi:MAG: ADP-dependent NAD(P)H-hydrate dehydratase, partial [Bacteroidota bacterium]
IVLKGAYTSISTPDGKCFFNTTGNAGLAKGGSGDTLTGIITAFLAQGLNATDAAIAAVYIHGLAADCAVKKIHPYSLTASDVTEFLSEAFIQTV